MEQREREEGGEKGEEISKSPPQDLCFDLFWLLFWWLMPSHASSSSSSSSRCESSTSMALVHVFLATTTTMKEHVPPADDEAWLLIKPAAHVAGEVELVEALAAPQLNFL